MKHLGDVTVIDLFAGAGGLGDGFSTFKGNVKFNVELSVEMEANPCETLRGRKADLIAKENSDKKNVNSLTKRRFISDYRKRGKVSDCLSDSLKREVEFKVLQATMGELDHDLEIENRLKKIQEKYPSRPTVLVGGPPCQAYSIAGRAKNSKNPNYVADLDSRNFLYREYLRYITILKPEIFVMENVAGLLSHKVNGHSMIDAILQDLSSPKIKSSDLAAANYRIFSLVDNGQEDVCLHSGHHKDAKDYLVKSEEYGIPQARHRVILVGVREDIKATPAKLKRVATDSSTTVRAAISDLPKIRAGVTKSNTTDGVHAELLSDHASDLLYESKKFSDYSIASAFEELLDQKELFLNPLSTDLKMNYGSPIYNHNSRNHMSEDLKRYLYVSVFSKVNGRSPKGPKEFKYEGLSPNHKNWSAGKHFVDRFRCQLWEQPSNTIVRHIQKDGHHFIHPDPFQCRSLSVREAARLQTFDDEHFFEGPLIWQYGQVGNAVPPKLSKQIAEIVADVFEK